jgi:hypothetical protein
MPTVRKGDMFISRDPNAFYKYQVHHIDNSGGIFLTAIRRSTGESSTIVHGPCTYIDIYIDMQRFGFSHVPQKPSFKQYLESL